MQRLKTLVEAVYIPRQKSKSAFIEYLENGLLPDLRAASANPKYANLSLKDVVKDIEEAIYWMRKENA